MTRTGNWHIIENSFPKSQIHHKETVFTIGNGYFSSRGSFEEGYPCENATTFVHGVFNDVPVFHTELVNFPIWFSLKVYINGEPFRLDHGKILEYHRSLNLKNGLVTRQVAWESSKGHRFNICFERFMDMANIHHAVLNFRLSDFNFAGQVQIQASLPGVVSNERFRHWQHIDQERIDESSCLLGLRTIDSKIEAWIAESVILNDEHKFNRSFWNAEWMPTLVFDFDVNPGESIEGTKYITIFTTRDVDEPRIRAVAGIKQFAEIGFEESLARSEKIWEDLWSRSNVIIQGDDLADLGLRYNLFQILIASPRHDDTVSIGAKTLSGYGYRGHVFWDTEIFILPFLIFTQPDIARNLLMYRYHTLPGARKKAELSGYKGAMYAWESASTGEEVTPKWVIGPGGELVRIWCGDIEQHITADIVYGIRQYWHATNDDRFMENYGAEIIFSAAQFYASRLEWPEETGLFHIRNVIGPDEYHEHVDDNAMTNLMAAWTLEFAGEVAIWLKNENPGKYEDLLAQLRLQESEIQSWNDSNQKIALYVREDGIIEQFKGYFDLTYLDQSSLEPRNESLQSLFGIIGVQEYQFIKQPDVVMGMFLLPERFETQQIQDNINFYTSRTDLSYGSSLGPSVQALMLARHGAPELAKDLFIKTLLTDLDNNRGNTADGIHAASAGAVWQVMLFGFLGYSVKGDLPVVNPILPGNWKGITLQIHWKNEKIEFDIT